MGKGGYKKRMGGKVMTAEKRRQTNEERNRGGTKG